MLTSTRWSDALVLLRVNSLSLLIGDRLTLPIAFNWNLYGRSFAGLSGHHVLPMVALGCFFLLTSCTSVTRWGEFAQQGYNDKARSSIMDTKDLVSRNKYGETPLLWGARIGDASFVSELIALGANVNDVNRITGETPLIVAAKNGHIEVVKRLVNAAANRNATDNLGSDAVAAAISAAKFEALLFLVSEGSSIDQNRMGPLVVSAANAGEIKIVEYLLQAGASINYQGTGGDSVLMAAVKSGRAELVRALLARGAKVELTDAAGRTPLTLAAQSGRWEICEALLASGSSIDAKDARGNTPLMWAILMGHQDVAMRLIQQGADVMASNVANKTALYLAAFMPETARALLQRDARIVEVTVENENYHRSALAYHWLAVFIEREIANGRESLKRAADIKLAYAVAGRSFDTAGNQYAELASKLRTEAAVKVLGAAALTAASIALATAQAHQAAHQMAELSALRSAATGGSGVGVGWGFAPFSVVTPNTGPLVKSAEDADVVAVKVRELAQQCKKQVECYDRAGAGEEHACFPK